MASKRILVAEDDEALRDMYKVRLEMEGYEVVVANDGEEALATLQNDNRFSLITLDIMMPKITGMEALNIIKNTANLKNIPVLMLTALSGMQIKGLVEGATAYLIKSETSIDDIINKINELAYLEQK